MADKSGIAVMASITDYGLTGKEARGVYAGETALLRSLAEASASLQRFAQRLGISLDGKPKDVAATVAQSYHQAKGPQRVSVQAAAPGAPELGM